MLETQTGCKIAIRGKGANSKRNTYNILEQDDHEDLHVLITGNTLDDIEHCEIALQPLLDPSNAVRND